jgi:uncharacterized repeat protein (TIGR04076 family)
MTKEKEYSEIEEFAAKILKAENRYYQEVEITKVNGECPYGHKEGEKFKVTAMNSDGLCGSLLKFILAPVVTLHYGGGLIWEKNPDAFKGFCPEMGRVQVEVKRLQQEKPTLLKTGTQFIDMTGKGYPALDKHRVFVEVLDIAHNCYWGHKVGDRFEVDPFNVGGACCLLYGQLYSYLHVLLSGATPAWAMEEHSMSGECPDTYDRLCFRLSLEGR